MTGTGRNTMRHPITGQDVVPADLMADAKAGKPFGALTDNERKEFNSLSPSAREKVIRIANAAILARAGNDQTDASVTPQDAKRALDAIFEEAA